MKTALRSLLGCALFLFAAPALAEANAPTVHDPMWEQEAREFIKRIVVNRPRAMVCSARRIPDAFLVRADCSHSESNCSRKQAPTWMLRRMPVLVPDGTPQTVYRAPTAGVLP